MEAVGKHALAFQNISFPVWKSGEEDTFMHAADVQTISTKYQGLKKALQTWSAVKKAVGFKVEGEETTTIDGHVVVHHAAATYISSYTLALLIKSKGWANITPKTVTQDGATKDLYKSMQDALAAAKNTEGVTPDPVLEALATAKMILGASGP